MRLFDDVVGAVTEMKPRRLGFLVRGRAGRLTTAVLMLALCPVSHAEAHALVVDSSPAANATVAEQELDLRIRFSDRIDKKRSKLGLASAAGQVYPVQVIEANSADTLAGHVAGLPAGAYRMQWQVLAVDGHITRGEIPFTVTAP